MLETQGGRPLAWQTFERAQQSDWRVAEGVLVDEEAGLVSRSLLDNWLLLHSAPTPNTRQWKLQAGHYAQPIAALERVWTALFGRMLALSGRALLRLRPWPAGYTCAVALRYDVDRPVSAARITEIAGLQSAMLNGPCGSWYYFAADAARGRQRRQHNRFFHELGVHALKAEDVLDGEGVTHHSAPTSEYWQGDRTLARLAVSGARYAEFLASRTGTPRPAWLAGGANDSNDSDASTGEPDNAGSIASTWLTPLHFPLEGSTSDETLTYFDQLIGPFRQAVNNGDLVIIASHPDLSQDILQDLIARERLDGAWPATVAAALARFETVMAPGAIQIVDWRGGNPVLCSCGGVADLQLEVLAPDDDEPRKLTTQLMPSQPREVDVADVQ